MKTLNQLRIQYVTTLFCSMMLSVTAMSQSHVTMGMRNITANQSTIEYDLYIVNDGTTELKLSACSYGVNFNNQITNQGSISYQYKSKSRASELNGLSEVAHAITKVDGIDQARMTTVPSGYAKAPVLTKGVPFLVGHFVLQNSSGWAPGSEPDFSFQEEKKIGLTTTQVVVYEDNDHHLVALTPSLKSVATHIEKALVLNEGSSQATETTGTIRQELVKSTVQDLESNMVLYPNPAKDEIKVDFTMSRSAHIVLNIIDFHGRLVKQIHADVIEGRNSLQVDVNSLSAGLYAVRLSNGNELLYQQNFTKQ